MVRTRRLYRVRMHHPAPGGPYGGACMEVCLQRLRAQALMTSIRLEGQLQRVRTRHRARGSRLEVCLQRDHGTHAAPVFRMECELQTVHISIRNPSGGRAPDGTVECARRPEG